MPPVLGTTKAIAGFDPRSVASCMLWLDSADASTLFSDSAGTIPATLSGTVGFWKDKSSRATSVSNATAGQRPTYTSSGLSYAGGQGLFGTPATASSGGLAAFVVFNPTTPSTRTSIVRWWSGSYLASLETTFNDYMIPSTYRYQAVSPVAGTNNIMSLVAYSTTGIEWAVNVANSSTSWTFTGSPSTSTELGIGSRGGLSLAFVGKINEVIIYDAFLTVAQKQSIEGYLAWKWSITRPTTHPFVTVRPFTRQFNPIDIPGLHIWLDGADSTTMTPSTSSPGTTTTAWRDKQNGYSFTPGAIQTQASNGTVYTVNGPTYYTGGGLYFSNASYLLGNGQQGLGIWGTNLNSSPLYTLPNQAMTMVIASYPFSNNSYRRIAYTGSYQLGGSTLPNFLLGPEMGASEGGTMAYDFNGSAWGQINYTNAGYNSNAVPRVDVMVSTPGANQWWWTNGTLNTFQFSNIYTSTYSNYPVSYFFLGSYTNTIDGNRNFHGVIYEVMFYSNALTTSQRQQAEGYLARKWGFASSLPSTHPYYSIPPSSVVPFSPTSIPGCTIWLDASDPVTSFTGGTWYDKSGKANNFTTTSGTCSVILDGANRVVSFPSGAIMTSSASIKFGLLSIFYIVFRVTAISGSGIDMVLGFSDINPSGNLGDFSIRLGAAGLFGTPANTGNANDLANTAYLVNGSLNPNFPLTTYSNDYAIVGTLNVNGPGTSVLTLSSSFFGRYFIGNIAEFLFYPDGLTLFQRQEVEGYLASKWLKKDNTLPTTHPYYRISPAVDPNNIFRTAATYLPLKTGFADLGNLPQTITNNGSVPFFSVAGRTGMQAPNSISSYLSFPYVNQLAFTLCFWLYPNGSAYYTAISITNSALNNPALQVDLTSATGTTIYTAMPNQWTNQPSGTTKGTFAWTHFAITVNQTTFVEQLYINGALVSTVTGSGTGFAGRSDIFVLGRSGDAGRAYLGYISQFAFFPYALSAAEVITVYNTIA